MIIIDSDQYGEIIIPVTIQQSERYSASVPSYSRDNTSNNILDSVGSGAVKKPNVLYFTGIINNNTGGVIPYQYDIEQIRQQLINLYDNSALFTLTFGASNSFYLFNGTPTVWENTVIQDMQIDADASTGASYNVTITFSQEILVDTIFNPDVINVPSGTSASSGAGGDAASKSLSPINNGTSPLTPPSPVTVQDIENDFSKFEASL